MTDIDHPKIGSGEPREDTTENIKDKTDLMVRQSDTTGVTQQVKRHKRAHSRNKSISGRQDFIDEIANGNEYKADAAAEEKVADCSDALLLPSKDDETDRTKISIDETDALPPTLRYNSFDFLCTFISVVTYVLDVVMDCIVAYYFYHLAVDHGIYHYWYFGLTIFFIVMPSLTMTGFSFRWYLMDSDNPQLPEVGMVRWVLRLVVLLLQIAPILRYVDSIRYGLMSRCARAKELKATTEEEKARLHRERVKWYTLMVYEDADATLLRLYESFMESAPQLVLQIYILLKDPHASRIYPYKHAEDGDDIDHSEDIVEPGVNPVLKLSILVMSVTSSLVSLAWSLVVYHRSLRYTYPHKKNISLLGTLFQFLWHFCSITARVLALSLFASALPQWIGPLCAAHWVVMASWVITQRTKACNTRCEEFLFALVLGAIYIFMFFNAKEERTRYKYLLYYCFCLLENTAIICIWFMSPTTILTSWYVFPAMVGHYLTFFAGIMFMLCYYLWFHPTGIDISFPHFRSEKKLPKDVVEAASEPVEMKVMLLKDNKIASSVSSPVLESEQDGEYVSEKDGHLARFLSEHSDKVAVRRFSSLPTGPVSVHQHTDPWGARKLKYMGQKSQDA